MLFLGKSHVFSVVFGAADDILIAGGDVALRRIFAMNKFEKLRKQADDRYKQAIAEAKRAYDEACQFISYIEQQGGASNGTKALGEKHGNLTREVKDIVAQFTDDFSIKDVWDSLMTRTPDLDKQVRKSSVSSVLRRLAKEGQLEEISKGKGKRPTVYRSSQETGANQQQPGPLAEGTD